MSNEPAISVRGLRKTYGDLEAVRGIDLEVLHGEIFALLGPNGAGKTTAVEIMEGYRDRTAGEVSVLGHDPGKHDNAFKEKIGIVLQESGVDPYLTVEETVELYRGYFLAPRSVDDVLGLVGLRDQRERRVIKLSGGQKRRLDVAVGLCGDPELIFLDEPTTGFDPAARRDAWQMIKGLQSLGKTVLLTTHYMEEAEYLADRVALIRRGEIIAQGHPSRLMSEEPETVISFVLPPGETGLLDGIAAAIIEGNGLVRLETHTPTALLYELTRRAGERGIELPELHVSRPTLEDMYLRLVADSEPETV